MKHLLLITAFAFTPVMSQAQTSGEVIEGIVRDHILSGFVQLEQKTAAFSQTASSDCTPTSAALRDGYADAFDAWVLVSHLRFGPTEVGDRGFALAFWPDSRGTTPRSLGALITDQDAVVDSSDSYGHVSIAARGFYAMELLLYDAALSDGANPQYLCSLIQAVAGDMATTTAAIAHDWREDYAARLIAPSSGGTYRGEEEVLQELFKALGTGLQFTSEVRLGRPLGTFDRPRPNRAEVWRAGRSARHVVLSLTALRDLSLRLSAADPAIAAHLAEGFDLALARMESLDDPIFAGVEQPQGRLRLEVVQQAVNGVRAEVRDALGPHLGVAAGFNALDGD
ncbi:imelysin family protein [Sulfitobacter guttiformis]|uniref:Imelysin-like domain-containing protein n=1 Tax=Sulfitobacter guttiformis TaxID=74349 RepID=A0A420DI40_9RHOB|nr:imelysin family protein [Sulfitobacter guttiformis]KIN72379.1 Imelysin superfamily protein [Sulfitobacter guttiformis KCTC 32187]RKE93865.1 hypothetical protein C8N30_2966 [Sulfitobacter guttiformis]